MTLIKPAQTQGTPGAKPKTWLNQRELGRLFGLNGLQMGKKLFEMGWRNEKAVPSQEVIENGLARMKEVPTPHCQWHAKKAVFQAQAYGLVERSQEELFIHAVVDKLSNRFRNTITELKRTKRSPTEIEKEEVWKHPINNYLTSGIVGEMTFHLNLADRNAVGIFVDGVVKGLLAKKFPMGMIKQMLWACGEWDAYESREQARCLKSTIEAQGLHSRVHRL